MVPMSVPTRAPDANLPAVIREPQPRALDGGEHLGVSVVHAASTSIELKVEACVQCWMKPPPDSADNPEIVDNSASTGSVTSRSTVSGDAVPPARGRTGTFTLRSSGLKPRRPELKRKQAQADDAPALSLATSSTVTVIGLPREECQDGVPRAGALNCPKVSHAYSYTPESGQRGGDFPIRGILPAGDTAVSAVRAGGVSPPDW
jgi:hypothetical protein